MVRLFEARRSNHLAQVASLERQIAQLRGEISANEGGQAAAEQQLALWRDERGLVADLVERGVTPRRELMDFDRNIAALAGEREEYAGLIEAARQGIARAEAEIEALEQQRRVEIAAERGRGARPPDRARLADPRASRT